MNQALKTVLSLSFSGAVVILVLLFCKPLLQKRLSKRWQYYIWLVVLARLLLPFTPEVSPVGALFQEMGRGTVLTEVAPGPQPGVDRAKADGSAWQGGEEVVPTAPARLLENLMQVLWLLWLVAALLLLIRKMTSYQSFVRYLKAGRVEVSDTALLDRLAQVGAQAGVKRPVELYTNALVASPLLLGFFRPCIILPTADLTPGDFDYTVLHELTHYKRGDLLYKWLVQLAVCLHWFNPLVYIMEREVSRACELACDEAVIKGLDAEGRRAYGDTLIHAAEAGGRYQAAPAVVTLHEGGALLKERLGAIMDYRKKTKRVAAASLALTMLFTCGAAAIGAYAMPVAQSGVEITTPVSGKVMREGGVYYIFCDGAGEDDRPISGVTEGDISFVLVRKDGYTSIGPVSNTEKRKDEVSKQCDSMLKAGFMTQEEAKLVVEVAANVQSGNGIAYGAGKEALSHDREYAKWGVTQEDGAYYYKNERVRIFMDMRENKSFVNFRYDGVGTVDLRLQRGSNGAIIKMEYLTKTEAEEIQSELCLTHSDPVEEEDVSRLQKEMAPEKVQGAISACDAGKWYVIVENGYQYIYYNGVPHNYAWQPELRQDSATMKLFDIGRSTGTYVLLRVPGDLKLTIYYNRKNITFEMVNIQ